MRLAARSRDRAVPSSLVAAGGAVLGLT